MVLPRLRLLSCGSGGAALRALQRRAAPALPLAPRGAPLRCLASKGGRKGEKEEGERSPAADVLLLSSR